MALLVPMGVLLTHLLAYTVPHVEEPAGDHHHLVGLAAVATVALAAAIAGAAVHSLRGASGAVPLARLSAAQGVAYALWELGEGVLGGASIPDTLTQPTFRTGIVLQVAVALALVGLLRVSAEVARRFAPDDDRPAVSSPEPRGASPTRVHMARQLSPATRRGPPAPALS